MGHITHKAIIVTGWEERWIIEARAAAIDIFEKHANGRNLLSQLVGEIIPGCINGYFSFWIAPDGSKLGWETQRVASAARDEFKSWLRLAEKQNKWIEWCEVAFGTDDSEASISDSQWRT